MSRIRIRCQLDDAAWARIDALPVGAGEASLSQAERRERAITRLVIAGLAVEAATAATPAPLATPTPRNDLPSWLAEAPTSADAAPGRDAEDPNSAPRSATR